MISHGFVSGAMFLCIGVLYDRVHSREISAYGGVANTMPKFAAFAVLFAMANCGLPGTAGFVGEWMVILGTVKVNFWIAAAAATTLIWGAGYTLWMVKRVYFGAIANEHVRELADLDRREFAMLAALAIAVLAMGLYPKPFTDVMHTSVVELLRHVLDPEAGSLRRRRHMNWQAVYPVLPEIALLVMACVVALADLWVPGKDRIVTYCLAQASLGVDRPRPALVLLRGSDVLRDAADGRRRPDGPPARPVRDAGDDDDARLHASLRGLARHAQGRALHALDVLAARHPGHARRPTTSWSSTSASS